MPRAAKAPIVVPAGVDVKINGQAITIKGKNGELTRTPNDAVEAKHVDSTPTFGPCDGYADGWAQAGTVRALLNSMVIGVTEGFAKKLQLADVDYRATIKGNVANLSLGSSHPVDYQLSMSITVECPAQTEIVLRGADKQAIGQVATDLHAYRRPEPYRGRGAHYADEIVRTKETKKKRGNTMDKKSVRIRRAARTRREFQELGATRPVVHRALCHIYVQVIAPNGSEALVAASIVGKAIAGQLKYTGDKDIAVAVDKAVAERVSEKGIKDVSSDCSRFQYHGRAQALVDVTREAGLQF